MDDTSGFNTQDEYETEPRPAGASAVLRGLGFVGLLVVLFGAGFYLIGPRLQQAAMPPASPTSTLSDQDKNWGQAPVPKREPRPRPKPEPEDNSGVTVEEVSPTDAESAAATPEVDASSKPEQNTQPTSPERTAPTPTPEPNPPAVANGSYVVQIGVFASRSNAEIASSRLSDLGYGASIKRSFRAGIKARYQVVVGSPKDREGADKLASELKNAGVQAYVVPLN